MSSEGKVDQLNVKMAMDSGGELLVGNAPAPVEQNRWTLAGVGLSGPAEFYEKCDEKPSGTSYVQVCEEDMSIRLVCDPQYNNRGYEVCGSLRLHSNLYALKINTGHEWDREALARTLRFSRPMFLPGTIMNVISALKNFQAKVDQLIDKSNDDRGTKRDLVQQVVENSDLAKGVTLNCPVFRGQEDSIECHVDIYFNYDPSSADIKIWLESPELKEYMDGTARKLLKEEAGKFGSLPVIWK